MTASPIDVLTVGYGPLSALAPLCASLRAQTRPPRALRIWHNGPEFPADPAAAAASLGPGVTLASSGENLGYGGGINRLVVALPAQEPGVVVVVNPDVELAPDALARLADALEAAPDLVVVGGALFGQGADPGGPARVNAYGLRLTFDLVGVHPERGLTEAEFAPIAAAAADSGARYLGPSGALFAVDRARWADRVGGPLFCESLFLYLEDVALWLKLRRAGAGVALCPDARGRHAMSASTGLRSPLKLYHVERNRLWLLRALGGLPAALAPAPLSLARLGAYGVASLRAGAAAPAAARDDRAALLGALLRGWRDGLTRPVPRELAGYLGPPRAPVDWWGYLAPLRAQLRDPVARQ